MTTSALRVLIADDEAPARRRLRALLAARAEVEIVGEAADGEEAVTAIGALSPDLVLLDIRMPRLDGFGVIAAVGAEAMPQVVFTTAYDEYAVRAFAVRALDYLLKPVDPARLSATIALACTREAAAARDEERARRASAFAAAAAETALPARVLAQDANGDGVLVTVADMFLVRAQRNYVALHTRAGTYRVRSTIVAAAARLDPAEFLRVNRSDIVRLDAVVRVEPWTHGDARLTLPDGTALLWSRRYRARDAERFALLQRTRAG
ncbi:MAG: LytTR family DNA-binding domain-containing protein [Gemmatimonadaceae bacterium]|nr:LytTR family DNA-binding domain-containing protein [Gemmatimonadaceae bacterium]